MERLATRPMHSTTRRPLPGGNIRHPVRRHRAVRLHPQQIVATTGITASMRPHDVLLLVSAAIGAGKNPVQHTRPRMVMRQLRVDPLVTQVANIEQILLRPTDQSPRRPLPIHDQPPFGKGAYKIEPGEYKSLRRESPTARVELKSSSMFRSPLSVVWVVAGRVG